MSTFVLTNAKIYLGAYDISGKLNVVRMMKQAESVDDTCFGASIRTARPGLQKGTVHTEGFVSYGVGEIDDILLGSAGGTNLLGVMDVPLSVCGQTGAAGERIFFLKSLFTTYEVGGKVGEMNKLTTEHEASGLNNQLIGGTILEDGTTLRTTSGVSSNFQVGSVSATQRLWGIVHVQAATSVTSLVVRLKSAASSGGSYTTRLTFATTFSGLGSEFAVPVSGPITDTYWEADWTLTGTSFKAVVAVGIL